MDDLISRQAAINTVSNWLRAVFGVNSNANTIGVLSELRALPSAEPEIIRCKDCRHWLSDEFPGNNDVSTLNLSSYPCKIGLTGADWFCGYVERRADESD